MLTHKFRLVGSGQWSGLRSIPSGPKSRRSLYGLAVQARPKCGYWPDRTDRKMVLGRPSRQKNGIGRTEQTGIWVLARRNRPTYGY